VGTTKLTRKEIIAEDPVHEAIMWLIGFFRENGKKIGIALGAVAVLGLGVYVGLRFLENRELLAQQELAKGLDFFHAEVSPDAKSDPYGNGPVPTFSTNTAKYQAAAKEFSSVISRQGYAKIAIIARYYLGLTQLQLGQLKEAVLNLESVAGNSRNRAVGFLAKKVLATHYSDSKNYKEAERILESMIGDPQCDLPKDDLSIQLSRVLVAEGKRSEAIKVLTEANSQNPASGTFKQQLTAELDKLLGATRPGLEPQSSRP
jgi:predicted negative regulator of RcsB-dependent stress response